MATYKDLAIRCPERRDELAAAPRRAGGIQTKKYFRPLHTMPAYEEYRRAEDDLADTRAVADTVLCLPIFNELEDAAIRRVGEAVLEFYDRPPAATGSAWPSDGRVEAAAADPHPLVSIVIATYNRGRAARRADDPFAVAPDLPRWEAVIVGDACTDDTGALIAGLGDPRLRFENLAERGVYPEDPLQRWMVAGCAPMNRALELARGDWLAYLDDDDVFTEDHIDVLLEHALALARRVRLRGGRVRALADGMAPHRGLPARAGQAHALERPVPPLAASSCATTSAWKWSLGADAHLWMRMKALGVRFAFLDRVVCRAPLRPGETSRARGPRRAGQESLRPGGVGRRRARRRRRFRG